MLKASRRGATFFCLIALGGFFFLTVGLAKAGTVVEQGSEGLFILEGGKSTLIYRFNLMEEPRRSPFVILGAITAAIGACIAIWLAAASKILLCEAKCRHGLMTAQLIVAVLGLAPISCLLYAAMRGRRTLAVLAFASAAAVYLLWGILSDAAVHGWHDLKVF